VRVRHQDDCGWHRACVESAVIDFLSTRDSTTADDAACCRLFTAIIALAIHDCVKQPNAAERSGKANFCTMDRDAYSAITFLFGKDSPFAGYASLIGTSANDIRRALLNSEGRRGSELQSKDFRLLRMRLWWSGIDPTEVMK
jgi:hypothetical protein